MTTTDDATLRGRHAVVTGGSRGIGAAVARELAARGAVLTLVGRNEERLQAVRESLAGVGHGVARADLTDARAATRALGLALEANGPAWALVNNAGASESAAFMDTDEDLWRRMLDANLMSAVECTRAVLPAMRALGGGRVVNIASTAGLTGYRYVTAYTAAKHAVVGFTRALALEVARDGITANAVCPGYADTELLSESIAHAAARTGRAPGEIRRVFESANPQGRLIQPAEVARAVAWLCEPGQQGVNGQALVIDGGSLL